MYARNNGDYTLKSSLLSPTGGTAGLPVYQSASFDEGTGDIIVKIVCNAAVDTAIQITADAQYINPKGTAEVIKGSPAAVNSIADPMNVSPALSAYDGFGTSFIYDAPAYSFSILRMSTKPDSQRIVALEPVGATFVKSGPASLPATVTAVYADGHKGEIPVDWANIEDTITHYAGTYKTNGFCELTHLVPELTITVVESYIAIGPGNRLVYASFANNADTAKSAFLWAAVYNPAGRLVYVGSAPFTVGAYEVSPRVEVAIPESANIGGATIRGFIFDDEYVPLMPAVDLY